MPLFNRTISSTITGRMSYMPADGRTMKFFSGWWELGKTDRDSWTTQDSFPSIHNRSFKEDRVSGRRKLETVELKIATRCFLPREAE